MLSASTGRRSRRYPRTGAERVAVQGNLDPLALIAGGDALDRAIDDVLANYAWAG